MVESRSEKLLWRMIDAYFRPVDDGVFEEGLAFIYENGMSTVISPSLDTWLIANDYNLVVKLYDNSRDPEGDVIYNLIAEIEYAWENFEFNALIQWLIANGNKD